MSSPDIDPKAYLAAPNPSFWRWDEGGKVVSWVRGETIAFGAEVERVLERQVESGLPPLGLILLVLAACRDTWREAVAQWDNLHGVTASLATWGSGDIKRLMDGLMSISRLPSELRHPIEAKVGLVRFLFETSDACVSAEAARAVCDGLSGARPVRYFDAQPGNTLFPLASSVPALLDGFERFDESAFRMRNSTGLDQMVQAAEIDRPVWERVRQLIADLQDDEDLQGFARLARALMAVVHMPRPISAPEELPMGGFTDIANRGPVDRLLVSELAHDDLTLAVRIALNEALYLRREAPPKTPSLSRFILIDAGIRMWGVPRLYATAVAMALLATSDRHAGMAVFRAEGATVRRVDLTTRAGLTEHLSVLKPHAHPGPALRRFVEQSRRQAGGCDCIVVTCVAALTDPGFQQALAQMGQPDVYLATVESSGEFQLLRHGPHACKPVCRAKLPLGKLLQPRTRKTVPLMDSASDSPPALCRQESFPLRLPMNRFNLDRSWVVRSFGVFEISRDQRLLLWKNRDEGPRQIVDCVPSRAKVLWGSPSLLRGKAVAALGEYGSPDIQLLIVDTSRDQVQLVPLDVPRGWQSVVGYRDVVFVHDDNEVRAFHVSDGSVIGSVRIQGLLPVRVKRALEGGRFFFDEAGAWYALAYDGQAIRLEKVVDATTRQKFGVVSLVDMPGHEGPVGITSNGQKFLPAERRVSSCFHGVTPPLRVVSVSDCGRWIFIRYSNSISACIELSTEITRRVSRVDAMRELSIKPWVSPMRGHLHRRFCGVLIHKDVGFALVSRKGLCWVFKNVDGKLCLQHTGTTVANYRDFVVNFSTVMSLPHVAYELTVARLKKGGQAILDSRGLLHLRCPDSRIPEVSIVLIDGEVAGWCDDGRTWGPRYFVARATVCDANEIVESVLLPFQELVQ